MTKLNRGDASPAIAMIAMVTAVWGMISGPMAELGVRDVVVRLLGMDLVPAEREGRIIILYHSIAMAVVAIEVYMLTSLLGLRPETDAHRLGVVRPALPESVDWLELNGLRVGSLRADLRFERTRGGVAVQVRRKDRPLEILVEL